MTTAIPDSALPNFLVIGAAKAGTTALYEYLRQHPQIYMSHPIKEPKFFAYEGGMPDFSNFPKAWKDSPETVTDIAAYQALFAQGTGFPARGEASTLYLYYPGTAERIARLAPRMKLIAILRQPADRAFSHYLMLRGLGLEPLSFEDALAAEPDRIAGNWAPTWHYAATGRYCEQLARYRSVFPQSHIKVLFYDDFRANPGQVMQGIFDFLEVSPFQPDTSARHNATFVPKPGLSGKLIAQLRLAAPRIKAMLPEALHRKSVSLIKKFAMEKPVALDPATRADLTARLTDDILALQDLVGRDLSGWLKPRD